MTPVRTFKMSRNTQLCTQFDTCGLCAKEFPPMAYDGLLISASSLELHTEEIENVIINCPAGAIDLKEL